MPFLYDGIRPMQDQFDFLKSFDHNCCDAGFAPQCHLLARGSRGGAIDAKDL